MQLRIERNFMRWCLEDPDCISIDAFKEAIPSDIIASKIGLQKLRSYGISNHTLEIIYGCRQPLQTYGFARFKCLRVLCWYWPSGDKIIYPINSKNSLYCGDDAIFWYKHWPFLEKEDQADIFKCTLKEAGTSSFGGHGCLLVGGQSHFGHFMMDKIMSLTSATRHSDMHETIGNIVIPPDYSDLNEKILLATLNKKAVSFSELPKYNGIYKIHNIVVPSLDREQDCIVQMRGRAVRKNSLKAQSGLIYLTRGTGLTNDRLDSYADFIKTIISRGFIVLNPTKMSYEQRMEIISSARTILSDSGSCGFNAIYFGQENCNIQYFIPKRVFASYSPEVVTQLIPSLRLGELGIWRSLESALKHPSNPWYDICKPPDVDSLLE